VATTINLVPFGFTQTENLVYSRLVQGGPSSGYAVARDLRIARANAYQALRGLVSKGAAVTGGERPQRFRAVRPADLYAGIVQRHGERLDELEAQLDMTAENGAESFVTLTGERAFLELASRMAARETDEIVCLASARILTAMVPVLRKRSADGLPTTIWLAGEDANLPFATAGSVPLAASERVFGGPVAIQLSAGAAILGRFQDGGLRGYWSSEPSVVGATRGAVAALIGAAP
jgi:HTH-type transcriptional regulator, sugar sensing transcriptional regulator